MLEDASVQGLSPEGWANRVAAAAARWNTAMVVAEANNGGAMVGSVFEGRRPGAEGAAGARVERQMRQGRADRAQVRSRARRFSRAGSPSSRHELAGMQAGGGYEGPGRSPDRADAMVWAMTALSETRSGGAAGAEAVIEP